MNLPSTLHRCAGGIVTRRSDECVEFLLLKQIRAGGEVQWVMPKGHIEKGETSEGAAIREVREEAGIEELRVVACLGEQEFQYREGDEVQHKKLIRWYLLQAPHGAHPMLKTEEGFIKSKWLPYKEARKQCSHDDFREWVDRAAETLC